MRLFFALSLLAGTLSASNMWFDPPNPTSATPVVAHVTGFGCRPTGASFHRNGTIIGIELDVPQCLVAEAWETPVNLGVVPPGVYDVVAAPNNLLVAIAEGFLVVRDAVPPFDVVPNVLVDVGGGQVRLRGDNLYACPTTCESFIVRIGGQNVTVVSSTQQEIVVNAPTHAAGAVDVTIDRFASGPLTATAALDYFTLNKTPDPAFFEPVVFPALVTGAGAFGSQWTTTLSLFNDNDFPLDSTSAFFNVPCGPCEPRPHAHGSVTLKNVNVPAGLVFYVPRQAAPRLFFDILARDLSRQSEALGTEIPVVREKDLYDRRFDLLNVPTDAKYRVTLRALRTDGKASVRVRVFAMGPNDDGAQPLADTTLALTPPLDTMTYSSGAIADLAGAFPQLAGKGPLRIEVDGGTAQRVTWALVSITNNETQHVTVIAPH